MDPWNDAEQYPQDRLFQDAIHGDPSFYRRRLANEYEELCLQADDKDDVAALSEYPVKIIDIPKRGNNVHVQRQTETTSADAKNNELTRCLRNASIE